MLQCSRLTHGVLGLELVTVSPAGRASFLRLIILPAVLCCFQFLVDGGGLPSVDVPGE